MTNFANILPPVYASAYVKNATDALDRVLPHLEENSRTIVEEVRRTLIRTSLHLSPAFYGIDVLSDETSETEKLNQLELKAAELLAATVDQQSDIHGRGFDASQITDYLRHHPRGGPDLKITYSKLLAGGRSKQTVLLQVTGASDLPENIVLRRDWASAVTGTSVVSEYALLKAVFEKGLRVPEPLLLEKDPSALGSPFIIMSRISGAPLGDPFTPPASDEIVFDVARELAKLHQLDPETFIGLEGVSEQNASTEQLKEKLASYRTTLNSLDGMTTVTQKALDWLDSRVEHIKPFRALTHHDLGFHNMLCGENNLCAILDWELAHVGNPALDLGYLRTVVSKCVDWDDFLETYHAAGGIVHCNDTIDFFTVFASVWLYQLLTQARAAIGGGLMHDMDVTYVAAHFMPACLARIANELELVGAHE